jgi:putative ABC transport system substrate-binding protein
MGWLVSGAVARGPAYQQFVERAAELGYTEGSNLRVDYRSFASLDEGKAVARALTRSGVDLIVAQGPPALLAARAATSTIPIVTFFIADPVRMGVSRSLAKPDGNVTGFTWDSGIEGAGKLLEVIREMSPRTRRVGLLWNRENDSHPVYVEQFKAQGSRLGLSMLSGAVSAPEHFEPALRKLLIDGADTTIAFADPFTVKHRDALSMAVRRLRAPVVWTGLQWPLEGALLTYGASVADQPRRAAEYAVRVLQGAKPADLPFQMPTRDELIVDVNVARALAITLPPALLLRAGSIIGR